MAVLLAIVAYLIGSLPLGYWVIRRITGKDPRYASSYNLGLENTLRELGAGPVVLSGTLDLLKGYTAVWLAAWAGPDGAVLAALGVYMGHLYSLPALTSGQPLRGRGGLILVGILAGLSATLLFPIQVVLIVALAIGVLVLTRLAAVGVLALPLGQALMLSYLPIPSGAKVAGWLLLGLAVWRYKENLGRMMEGVEPRLGEPKPMPSDRQVVCAFIIHPLTVEDFFQSARFKWAWPLAKRGLIPQSFLEKLAEQIRPMKIGELRGMQTTDGREIRCYLLSAPLMPHQITGQPELALKKAIQGARLAKELGATVFGLGAFWSVVGDKGKAVQEAVQEIEVTNGGAYTSGTVKAAIPAILQHFSETGRELGQITAAVVGANGVVAFGIARQIAPLVGKLILVGRNMERLEKSADSLRKNLERKGRVPEMVITVEVAAIKEADLIFSATSDPKAVIFAEHVKPGAWIYDEGVPPDVDGSVKNVPGVRVIPGGVVRPPGHMTGNINLHFGEGAVPACLAETMILATEKAYDRKSLGGETKSENIQFFVERAEALGFKVVD